MKFFFSGIILFVFIISNKLFLFNEEFLILISFAGFCFVIYENLSSFFNVRFSEKSLLIKSLLLNSIDGLQNQLINKKKNNEKFCNLKIILLALKKYYLKFSKQFLIHLIIYSKNCEKVKLNDKLKEIKFLENSYSKFILLIVLRKTQDISLNKFFFENNLKIKRFRTLKSINNLNLIKKI